MGDSQPTGESDSAGLSGSDLPPSFGGYRLLSLLGKGGMARVFRAVRTGPHGFRKPLALKVILDETSLRDEAMRQALISEARLGGLLNHPNVVDIYDFGEADGRPWIAMELVVGCTLAELLTDYGAMPPTAAIEAAAETCRGLHYAHGLVADGEPVPVIHRDVKPSNIMLTAEGAVKIMDFGIAKAGRQPGSTTPGTVKGTPQYMSPEQAVASAVHPNSDLFSLAAVLHEMLTGIRLFNGDTGMALMLDIQRVERRVAQGVLDPAEAAAPGIGAILAGCLRSSVEDRPQTAREVEFALRNVLRRLRGESLREYCERVVRPRVGDESTTGSTRSGGWPQTE